MYRVHKIVRATSIEMQQNWIDADADGVREEKTHSKTAKTKWANNIVMLNRSEEEVSERAKLIADMHLHYTRFNNS